MQALSKFFLFFVRALKSFQSEAVKCYFFFFIFSRELSSSSSSKEDLSTEADGYWRKIWKEHYQQQYSSFYKSFRNDFSLIKEEPDLEDAKQKLLDKVDKALAEAENTKEKKSIYESTKYLNSVGYILKTLDLTTLDNSNPQK